MSQDSITKTAEFVKAKFLGEGSGHDWWHIYRVWQLAKHIGEREGGDMMVIELGALLHDIADWKFHNGSEDAGPDAARAWLASIGVDYEIIEKVCHIVAHVSYKGAEVQNKIESLEGKIVQDADRLDALGAIGVARAFSYGGSKNREMYNPNIAPVLHATAEEYKKNTSSTVNHFYEKLLLLKDLMNTKTGKSMAQERHDYTRAFLKRFLSEWEREK
jgi:uncharacterized protein